MHCIYYQATARYRATAQYRALRARYRVPYQLPCRGLKSGHSARYWAAAEDTTRCIALRRRGLQNISAEDLLALLFRERN